jgi:MFS family permease
MVPELIVAIILILGLGVISGFLTSYLYELKISTSDSDEKKAKQYLTASMAVGWSFFAVLLVIFIIAAVYAPVEEATLLAEKAGEVIGKITGSGNKLTLTLFIMISIVYFSMGVLLLMTVTNIKKGKNYKKNTSVYKNCIIIGCVCISLLVITVLYFIIDKVLKVHAKNRSS